MRWKIIYSTLHSVFLEILHETYIFRKKLTCSRCISHLCSYAVSISILCWFQKSRETIPFIFQANLLGRFLILRKNLTCLICLWHFLVWSFSNEFVYIIIMRCPAYEYVAELDSLKPVQCTAHCIQQQFRIACRYFNNLLLFFLRCTVLKRCTPQLSVVLFVQVCGMGIYIQR